MGAPRLILLDTTILIYAVGSEHPAREPTRRLIKAIRTGKVAATTTVDVIQEFVHVFARRRPRADAARLGRRFALGLAPLLVASDSELDRGLALYERHEELGMFDAVLAATALAHGVEALVSADRAFGRVPRLRHLAPGSPEFERLLPA